jgi:hypothetical protein
MNFYNLDNFFKKKIYEILQIYISFFSIFFYFILYVISKNTAINFIIITSLINIITVALSGNARNISLLFSDTNYCYKVFNFRLIISILLILLALLFNEFFTKYFQIEAPFFFLTLLLIITFWIVEPVVVFYELNNFFIKPTIFFLVHFFVLLSTLSLLVNQDLFFLFLKVIIFTNFLFILNFFFLEKIKEEKIKFKKKLKIFDYPYLSSISLVFSAFFIRFILIHELGNNLAADIIIGFSVANFPGSLVASFYGVKYLNKDILLPFIFKYILVLYLLLLFILIPLLLTNLYSSYYNFILIIIFSIIASFFIFFAQVFRIVHIGTFNLKYIFLKDIIFHISVIFLIYLVSYLNLYFYLIILVYSIFSFYIYCSTKFYVYKTN